jgi:hypothetical protein
MKAFYMRVNDDNQVMIMDLKKKIKKKYESLLLCASTVTKNQVKIMTCSFFFFVSDCRGDGCALPACWRNGGGLPARRTSGRFAAEDGAAQNVHELAGVVSRPATLRGSAARGVWSRL